jgi:cephalosporin-C deacetylase-like acetyl esterase
VTFLGLRPEVDPGRIGVMGMSYGGSTAVWLAATDPRVQCVVSAVAPGHGARWMEGVRTPAEWAALKERSEADRAARVRTGESGLLARGDILHMDPESARLSGRARQATSAAAAGDLPIEYVDETLAFNPEWVVGHIAPRGVLFVTCDGDAVVPPAESEAMYRAAGEPKKLVVLEGFSHFEVYTGDAFDQCAAEAAAWFDRHLKAA